MAHGGTVWFGVLGTLDTEVDGAKVSILSARTRTVLATLLCRPNRAVSIDELVDTVWNAEPPDGAAITLRSHVLRLRRCLGPAADRVETAAPGYRIRLDPQTELDATVFTELCQSARSAARLGNWPTVSEKAGAALALWRGTPLADVPAERLHRDHSPAWSQARAEAAELAAHADLALGRGSDSVAVLLSLADEQPHRESAHALLMAVLAGANRRAEALEVYRRLHHRLVRDLGIEPGPEIKALHQSILTAGAEPEPVPFWPNPQALPRDVRDFTGRDGPVEELVIALGGGPERPSASLGPHAPVVVAVDGMGGVGKTALAVHAAHRVRERFPDGQLFAELRGTSPNPAEPSAVLGSFLLQLGVSAAAVPEAAADRAAMFRSRLAHRKVLILLDDARDAGQVTPLIPAAPGCAVLVTVRNRMVGALAGVARLSLDGLPRAESLALLARIAGARRVADEPAAAEAIVAACADLPLAIRVAGGRLAARANWRMADLADRLAAARARLDELSYGGHDVRASFEIGYSELLAADRSPTGAASAFQLLGLWTGGTLPLPAAASLLGLPPADAEHVLEHLVDVHMLQSPAPRYYGLHDLLRDYAAERAGLDTDAETRRAAMARLADWFAQSAGKVNSTLNVNQRQFDLPAPLAAVAEPFVPDTMADAMEWGGREHTNLLEVHRLAIEYGLPQAVWLLTATAYGILERLRLRQVTIDLHEAALPHILTLADPAAEALLRNRLAVVLDQVGRHEEAITHLEASLALREATGDRAGVAKALINLGIVTMRDASPQRPIGYLRRAMETAEAPRDRASIHNNLAYLFLLHGQTKSAIAESEMAVGVYRTLPGPDPDLATTLENLAAAHYKSGDVGQAAKRMQEAVDIRRELADRKGLIDGLRELAGYLTEHGAVDAARAALEEAESAGR